MIGVIEHKMALLTMICGKYIDKNLLISFYTVKFLLHAMY